MPNPAPQCTRKPAPRVIQRKVTGQDFNLFHAIVGTQPILEPKEAERNAAEAMSAPLVEAAGEGVILKPRLPGRNRAKPQAAVRPEMLKQIRRACQKGISVRVKRPDMAAWLRRVSDHAFQRLEEAQMRLLSSRSSKAVPPAPQDQHEQPPHQHRHEIMRYNKVA